MTNKHFAKGQVLFREGEPADSVLRLLRGAVDIFRELDGEPILLGRVGAGQSGEMGGGKPPPSATAQAASDNRDKNPHPDRVLRSDCQLTAGRRELIQRLSQRLRGADDASSTTNEETAEHL